MRLGPAKAANAQRRMHTRREAAASYMGVDSEDVIAQAVMAMKQAVDVAIQHGDIHQDVVC